MRLRSHVRRARTLGRAICALPDILERIAVLEDFVVAFGDDLDQFERLINEAVALLQEGHGGREPRELIP